METNDIKNFLVKQLSFWTHLNTDEQKQILENAQIVSFDKGETIQSGNSHCPGLLVIVSGELRISMLSEEGKEITLYRLYPGDTCVLSASCVLDAVTFDVFVDAECKSEVIQINASTFFQLRGNNIYVEAFSYKIATKRFSQVMWAMQQILFMTMDKRLAIFLQEESEKEHKDDIKLTHEQIARYMGSAREVVSRMLKYFAEEGIVTLSRGGINIIDSDKLREIAEK